MSLNSSSSPYMVYCFCGNTHGGSGVGEEVGWAVDSTE